MKNEDEAIRSIPGGDMRKAVPHEKPESEQKVVVLVDEPFVLEAEDHIAGCQCCVPNAHLTFEYLLDAVTGCDPVRTEYLMCRPAKCPCCGFDVTEKTIVLV